MKKLGQNQRLVLSILYFLSAGGKILNIRYYESVSNPFDLKVSGESFAHIHGYSSFEEMMSDEAFWDKLNKFTRETGSGFPFAKLNQRPD